MSTTTTPTIPDLPSLHDATRSLDGWAWRAVPYVAGAVLLLAVGRLWWANRQRTHADGYERWQWQRDGSVKGPRIAQWRIRRAFAPYATIVPYKGGSPYDWYTAKPRRVARRMRAARRLWSDLADALGIPSTPFALDVWPEGRTWEFAGKECQDPRELARRLWRLGVVTRASHVDGPEQQDDEPGLFTIKISDVTRAPVTQRAPIYGYRMVPGATGDARPARVQVGEGPAILVGERLTSLYAQGATWVLRPDADEMDDLADEHATITQMPLSDRVAPPAPGETGSATRDTARRDVRDSEQPLLLTQRQYEALRLLCGDTHTVADLTREQGCVWGVAKRRLERLVELGLAERGAAREYAITPAGRAMFSDLPTPTITPTEAS